MILYTLPHWNHYLVVESKVSYDITLVVFPKGKKFVQAAYSAKMKPTEIKIPGVKVPKKYAKHNINDLWHDFLSRRNK